MTGELSATIERRDNGAWRIRVPLRREEVHVSKQRYAVEEVEIRHEYEDEPGLEPTLRMRAPVQPPR